MVRSRRPVRGGRKRVEKNLPKHLKHKQIKKKGKFNFRDSSYVKDRDVKNAEIENRRKVIEAKEDKKRKYESESSEEEQEEDPMKVLLSSFSDGQKYLKTSVVSESDSESEQEVLEEKQEDTDDVEDGDEEEEDVDNEQEDDEEEENDDDDDDDESTEDLENSYNKNDNIDVDDDDDDIDIVIANEDEEDDETSREDAGIINDPFSIHLNNDLSSELFKSVSNQVPSIQTHHLTWPTLGNLTVQIPKEEKNEKNKKMCILGDDNETFAQVGSPPVPITGKIDWNKLYVKTQIHDHLKEANKENIQHSNDDDDDDEDDTNSNILTPLQCELFSIMNNYQDLLYCERTFDNEQEIMFTYCLHAINHALKTRTKVLHHNAKITKLKKEKSNKIGQLPDEYRDQGLVRPKILIIVPFRSSCLKIVKYLISILVGEGKGGSVINKKRFFEDFSGNEIPMPKKNPKPEDYEKIFSGNTDDTFKIGIGITKKTIKLYSEFYSSDIIISSVLGLRMLIGAEGEEERDYDFLTSIEMLIMDQTELFYMQNWDHLLHVFNHLHLTPKKPHDTDVSRIKSWCASGWSKYYRQTLIFSGIQLPEIHSIFNKQCHNYSGKIKITNSCLSGSIGQIVVQVPQVFCKFHSSNYANVIEARWEFFINKILPQYKDSIMNHTMIYVPSYFDFVRIRNYMKSEELSFVQICEYSKDAKIARARDMFFHSDANFIIYSERFHFYRRIKMKGIRHLIFFAPPVFPHFYSEMCNLMQEANQNPRAGSESNMTVTTIYSKYDFMQLSAIVGTKEATKMINSDKNIHNTII